jgi:hypothetical protein
MTSGALDQKPAGHMSELLKLVEPQRDRLFVAALVALVGHAGLGLYAAGRGSTPRPLLPPVEVELVLREPPPPPPAPAAVPEPPAPKAAPRPAAPAPPIAKAAPPPAARAGAVVTALPDAAPVAAAEPFDFTSDPNSHVYGSGVVAVGGQASHGLAGAALGGRGSEPVRVAPRGDGLTAASDLSQRPRLREEDPCRGFFPRTAQQDVALVSVQVVIGKRGEVASARVESETPARQGFGAAARACMLAQTFAPALDRAGQPAATALAVNVRFSR